jgi:heat shock protein HslJ
MKNIYLSIALLLLCLTSCKNTTDTNNDSVSIDSTVVQNDTVATDIDTMRYESDSTTTSTDSSDAKSNVKLPNKISETVKVIPGEKGKFPLAETKWELVELNGKPIEKTTSKDYFINFDSKSGTFKAFAGCNRISGSYFMKASNKLGFSNIVTTRMACANMDVERGFYNNLQKTDNYMIEGKMLHLHIGKKAGAKFQAIK